MKPDLTVYDELAARAVKKPSTDGPLFTWTPAMIDRASRIPPECPQHPFPGYRVAPALAFRLAREKCPNPKRAEMLTLRLLRDGQLYLHNLCITLWGAAYRLGGGID